MTEKEKDLLDIFERFGDRAQNVIDFLRHNESDNNPVQLSGNSCNKNEGKVPNGIYIVYPDGHYERYSPDLTKKEEDMRVGISWDGHTWCIGTDYGDTKWTEASEKELEACKFGIMDEYEAVIDWDIEGINHDLREFWTHIPFKDGELMPTCPMVLVQGYAAKHGLLNAALEFVGMKPYQTGVDRWFAERYDVLNARFFNGRYGFLNYYIVYNAYRVQAVTLWNIYT